jgi:transcriptional regulator with GAF, ATPase, and Fis domain
MDIVDPFVYDASSNCRHSVHLDFDDKTMQVITIKETRCKTFVISEMKFVTVLAGLFNLVYRMRDKNQHLINWKNQKNEINFSVIKQ